MIRLRVSIAGLLALTALLSIGLAALKVSSRLWANALFSLALLCLLASIAGIIYRQRATRATCVGFALFGGTYLALAFCPPPFNVCKDLLVTAPILAILEDQLLDRTQRPARTAPASSRITPAAARSGPAFVELTPWSHWTETDRSNPFSNDSFQRIGHSLFTILAGVMGGLFCRFLWATREEPSHSS